MAKWEAAENLSFFKGDFGVKPLSVVQWRGICTFSRPLKPSSAPSQLAFIVRVQGSCQEGDPGLQGINKESLLERIFF